MPSKSAKQHRFMEAVAHSPDFAKKAGVPQSVGQDYAAADKGRKFGSGGRPSQQAINKPKTRHGSMAFFAGGGDVGKKLFAGKETYSEELKEAKAIKSGKITPAQYARGEQREKKMAGGGSVRGNGVAQRGKTRGKCV